MLAANTWQGEKAIRRKIAENVIGTYLFMSLLLFPIVDKKPPWTQLYYPLV
jgi:hypothetical protein